MASVLLRTLLFILFVSRCAEADDGTVVTEDASSDAYAQPIRQLSEAERAMFFKGRALVRQSWVIPPSENRDIAGLGPLYNRISCIACHAGNGRGFAPQTPQEGMRTMLVRLSIPGVNSHGGPLPDPRYGDQLNEHGVPGIPGEGRAEVSYQERQVTLNGGERVNLRKPVIRFTDLAYGALGRDIMTSPRIAPAINGLGLLEAVPDATLLALENAAKPAGIHGHINRVWDEAAGKTVIGRFGWKANMPNLRQQIAGAFVGDMGITSPLLPHENCTPVQDACKAAPSAGNPELKDEQLDQVEFYHLALAAPQGRAEPDVSPRQLERGAALFQKAQCAACHTPELRTGAFTKLPALANKTIHPYTDLLVHDMGEDLADHRPDYLATGREWRTPPLWGIGLAKKVEPDAGFLHDGRARSLLEAILWHGGEGAGAARAVRDMRLEDRAALLGYLNTL
jgi:CxxC motif-containing protein (DUF1111 family)